MTIRDERRSLYRVPARRSDALQVLIECARRSRAEPESLDVSAAGLGATFRAGSSPKLGVGDRVRIRLSSRDMRDPLEVDSTVAAIADRGGRRHVGFRFDAHTAALGRMPDTCYRLFNRRSAYRAALPERTRAEVRAWPAGEPRLELRMRDVSLAGLSATLAAREDDPLEGIDEVTLGFRLPQCTRAFRYGAKICCRERREGAMCYALVFDYTHTHRHLEQAEDLADFVMERYLEEFRGTHH